MAAIWRVRAGVALPGLVFAGACVAFGARGVSPADWAVTVALLGVPVATGYLLRLRAPGTPVGAALSWVGAAPAAVFAVEDWGETVTAPHPWPDAEILYTLKLGAWVWNPAGFAALRLVFPDGLLPRRGWRIAAGAVAAGIWLNLTMSFVQPADEVDRLHEPHGPDLSAGGRASRVASAGYGSSLTINTRGPSRLRAGVYRRRIENHIRDGNTTLV
ncbi:hypothetical protein [Actinomadura napierensis]|uniref:Uncharacterized protein n=1 Tax=Actinomadura napierensis TaxID=267854 RepID=A0ABP5JNZ1_9ACTN